MFGRLSRTPSQNSLNEGDIPPPSGHNRNVEPDINIFPEDYNEPELHASIKFTREHPIGAILVKLAQDNTALARKTNLRGVETNINDLCTTFHAAIQLEKEEMENKLIQTHENIEQALIFKDLNSHKINSAVSPPEYFSMEPTLTTPSRRAEALKIFSCHTKFSGLKQDNSISILEFLHTMKSAQEQMMLSESEFIDRLLICSTGHAHELILQWRNNGEDIHTIYHNLLINFDKRLAPEDAKVQLNNYKIPKSCTLARAEAQIMMLAGRSASSYPEGPSRTMSYNLDACNALIRALPRTSSATVNNLWNQLSARLGRHATFAELSRNVNLYRSSIDTDIREHGGESSHKNTKRIPTKRTVGVNRNRYVSYNVTSQINRPTLTRGYPNKNNNNPMRKNTSFTPRPLILKQLYNKHTTNNRNQPPHPSKKTPRRDNTGKFIKNNNNKTGSQNHCILCGYSNHTASSCQNMRNDSGNVVATFATHGVCGSCPPQVRPRLHHPPLLCPFRVGGPLQNKYKGQ